MTAPLKCPTCGSDCNERDELIKAEREIERLQLALNTERNAANLYSKHVALKERLARAGVEQLQAVAVLTNALRHIEGVALADDSRDLPGIAQSAREALDHWAVNKGDA